jgi:hypothetical protein
MMPPRIGNLPNVFERDALQKFGSGDLTGARIGSASVIAKLLAKGWIQRGRESRVYRITLSGVAALRAPIPR